MTEERLWNMQDVADYIGMSKDHLQRRVICRDDFPRSIRLPTPTGGKGHPRWVPAEVRKWMESHRESA